MVQMRNLTWHLPIQDEMGDLGYAKLVFSHSNSIPEIKNLLNNFLIETFVFL